MNTNNRIERTPAERAYLWARSKRKNPRFLRWTDEEIARASAVAHCLSVSDERRVLNSLKGRGEA